MGFQPSRRALLKLAGSSAAGAGILGLGGCASTVSQPIVGGDFDWNEDARAIRKRIVAPTFPSLHVRITDYGAQAGSDNDSTQAIASAIKDVASKGGGTVEVPAGEFYTGPVHLKSNINFHIVF